MKKSRIIAVMSICIILVVCFSMFILCTYRTGSTITAVITDKYDMEGVKGGTSRSPTTHYHHYYLVLDGFGTLMFQEYDKGLWDSYSIGDNYTYNWTVWEQFCYNLNNPSKK